MKHNEETWGNTARVAPKYGGAVSRSATWTESVCIGPCIPGMTFSFARAVLSGANNQIRTPPPRADHYGQRTVETMQKRKRRGRL